MKEFKEFVMRGNVMDLAVGVIIGGAFNTIVSSLCNDIIMPGIAWIVTLVSGQDFTNPETGHMEPVGYTDPHKRYNDLYYGIRVSWNIPTYQRQPAEFYYN